MENCKGISIEMEYERDKKYEAEDYEIDVVNKIVTLIQKWMKKGQIDGVYGLDKTIVKEIKDVKSWLISLKINIKKQSVIIETVFQLKTTASTYSLYQSE